jgi:hypothetical protein
MKGAAFHTFRFRTFPGNTFLIYEVRKVKLRSVRHWVIWQWRNGHKTILCSLRFPLKNTFFPFPTQIKDLLCKTPFLNLIYFFMFSERKCSCEDALHSQVWTWLRLDRRAKKAIDALLIPPHSGTVVSLCTIHLKIHTSAFCQQNISICSIWYSNNQQLLSTDSDRECFLWGTYWF